MIPQLPKRQCRLFSAGPRCYSDALAVVSIVYMFFVTKLMIVLLIAPQLTGKQPIHPLQVLRG